MKKLLLSAVAASFLLVSCGPDICDCVTAQKEMSEKIKKAEAEGDATDKIKKIEEEYKDIMEKCKKMGEGKSDDEMKELEKKAKDCK